MFAGLKFEGKEEKKAEKKAMRSNSMLSVDEEAPETPSGAQTITLSQEIAGAAAGAMMQIDPALMTYLNSMAYPAAMQQMYSQSLMTGYTTVMLRNIPNRYTRDMLAERLDAGYKAQYDFVYLPIDFNSKCNVGYAFINFRTPAIAAKFMQEFHGAKTKHALPGFSSSKVCEVSYARVQGRDNNMDNLRDEKFIEKLMERPEWQPLFIDDQGVEVPFSKTLGGGQKKRTRSNSNLELGTPTSQGPPGGFMMPPYGYGMMYPPPPSPYAAAAAQPAVPTMTMGTVLPSATAATMLMLKNFPLTFTRTQLIDHLKQSWQGQYDFLYLPGATTPKSEGGANRGYFFINFKTSKMAKQFQQEYHQKKVSECFAVEASEDEKVIEVTNARINNIEKSIERAQSAVTKKSSNKAELATWLPLLFRDNGDPFTFPMLVLPASQGGGAPSTPGALRPVPAKAVDSRSLEQKIIAEAKPETASSSSQGVAATPSTPSKARKPPPPPPLSPGQVATPKAATPMAGYPGYPAGYPGYSAGPFMGGYPGYPGNMHAMTAMARAQQSHAASVAWAAMSVQAAHAQAAQAAQQAQAQQAVPRGMQGVIDPLAAAVSAPRTPAQSAKTAKMSTEKFGALRTQIEFYFSTGNLCKDLYLRSHMDTNGWTPLELIAGFNQVRKFRANMTEIAEALANSQILEIDGVNRYIRLKDEDIRNKWARVPSGFTATPGSPTSGADATAETEAAATEAAAEAS
mmetsp:Transcript_35297/g.76935  ORF Transcript_35297/g.76935 Transcript_35297/m.76935 type:complete len:740 (-) Transcript_35297:134-2353(-)